MHLVAEGVFEVHSGTRAGKFRSVSSKALERTSNSSIRAPARWSASNNHTPTLTELAAT